MAEAAIDLISAGDDRRAEAARREALQAIAIALRTEAEQRVSGRAPIEGQWLQDLLNYHAKYDSATLEMFGRGREMEGRSQLFIGKTREKTNGMTSRLFNTLFPTDDKNWSIGPTPVPEMAEQSERANEHLDKLKSQEADPSQPAPPPGEVEQAQAEVDEVEAVLADARAKASRMSREIEDQLEECRFQSQCRDLIEDAVKIGTGLMLGPLANDRARRQWVEVRGVGDDGTEVSSFELQHAADPKPAAWRLDPWNCFPSTDARGVEDSEGFCIRHVWTAKQLRAAANMPGFSADAIREVLQQSPADAAPDYLAKLRTMGSQSDTVGGARQFYTVWQYIGPLTAEQMGALADGFGDTETAEEMSGEVDPLKEIQAMVWFCRDTVLKFALYPLDSGEPLVNAFRLEKEEGSFWGYGIPRLMRDDQAALNAAWRMMMDNADLASGGLIVIDRTILRPTDGTKRLYGRKMFEPQPGKTIDDVRKAIGHVDIPIRQSELISIIDLARRQIDEATMQPSMGGDGEQVPLVTNTAQGTALWLNTFNVMLVRVLKNYDDDLTVPMIRKFYDWNMQFSPKGEIKGDMQIAARGSSVLLVRAQQAQAILGLALALGGHPVYGPWIKDGETVREIYRSHSLDPSEFVRTDAEAEEEKAKQAEAAAQQVAPTTGPDPEVEMAKLDLEGEKLEQQAAMAAQEADVRLQIAQLDYDAKMAAAAANLNMQQDKLEADMAAKRESLMQKERSIAAEIAVRAQPAAPVNTTQIANT